MGLHRHVRDRRFAWPFAFVFALFLYPSMLQAADEQDSILGTWKLTATINGDVVDDALITFSPGGGLLVDTRFRQRANEERTTGHGTWVHRGGNTFAFAFERFVLRDGKFGRIGRTDETMTITGDTYAGEFKTRRINRDGEMSNVTGTGTTSAVRLKLLEATLSPQE